MFLPQASWGLSYKGRLCGRRRDLREARGVRWPLIRAVRGVLRYSTGGGGTCGALLRKRRPARCTCGGAADAVLRRRRWGRAGHLPVGRACACAVGVRRRRGTGGGALAAILFGLLGGWGDLGTAGSCVAADVAREKITCATGSLGGWHALEKV